MSILFLAQFLVKDKYALFAFASTEKKLIYCHVLLAWSDHFFGWRVKWILLCAFSSKHVFGWSKMRYTFVWCCSGKYPCRQHLFFISSFHLISVLVDNVPVTSCSSPFFISWDYLYTYHFNLFSKTGFSLLFTSRVKPRHLFCSKIQSNFDLSPWKSWKSSWMTKIR